MLSSSKLLTVAVIAILGSDIASSFSLSPPSTILRSGRGLNLAEMSLSAVRLPERTTRVAAGIADRRAGLPALRASAESEALKGITVYNVDSGAAVPVIKSNGRRFIAFLVCDFRHLQP